MPCCAWAGACDAIFAGVVVGIEAQKDIVVQRTVDNEWERTDCEDGALLPGIVITVKVEGVFRGDVGDIVDVHIGYERLLYWTPRPVLAGEGSGAVGWTGNRESGADGVIEVGQAIGFAVHYLPDYEAWSAMGELLFSFSRDELGEVRAYFQEGGCPGEEIQGTAAGLTLSELRTEIGSCEEAGGDASTAAAYRRSGMWAAWGPVGPHGDGKANPARYIASKCLSATPPPDPFACDSDSDCETGRCISGGCFEVP